MIMKKLRYILEDYLTTCKYKLKLLKEKVKAHRSCTSCSFTAGFLVGVVLIVLVT